MKDYRNNGKMKKFGDIVYNLFFGALAIFEIVICVILVMMLFGVDFV